MNLESLNLANNHIASIGELEKKTSTRPIDAGAPLGAGHLEYLSLDNNQIVDLSPLTLLHSLRSLSVDCNGVSDVTPLADLGQLEHLSIDRHDLPSSGSPSVYRVDGLRGLVNLVTLSLSNQQIVDIHPLENLSNLEHLDLENNRIAEIESLVGMRLADDDQPGFQGADGSEHTEYSDSYYTETGSGWQGNLAAAPGKFHDDYRFHEGSPDSTATATWTFEDLPPGEYQVWVTWPEYENRATDAPYTISVDRTVIDPDDETLSNERTLLGSVPVNQKLRPDTAWQGGYWQQLGGTYAVTTGDDGSWSKLLVELGAAADGFVAADAVRLVRVEPAFDRLQSLDISGNPLDNDAYEYVLPILQSTNLAALRYTDNVSPPTFGETISPHELDLGQPWSTVLTASDENPNTPIRFSATSNVPPVGDSPGVEATVDGNVLTMTPVNGFVGTARISVTAADGSTWPEFPPAHPAFGQSPGSVGGAPTQVIDSKFDGPGGFHTSGSAALGVRLHSAYSQCSSATRSFDCRPPQDRWRQRSRMEF